MNFLDLPIEVGVLILNYLDTKSKISTYNSSFRIRDYFAPCHVKRVDLSRSAISSARTLDEDLLVDLGCHIRELNLSGVPNLDANAIKPHTNRLGRLDTLDITFTDIYLPDLIEICPSYLKNISVNFFKRSRKSGREPIWEQCKDLFKLKAFINVHFVVFEFLDADAPLMFLDGVPMIDYLQITVADNYKDFWDIDDEDLPLVTTEPCKINFSKLAYLFRECRLTHKTTESLRGVANLQFEQVEYVYIMYWEQIVIYVSPLFQSLFRNNCSDLRVEVASYLPLDFMLDGNIVFKAWNKSTTVFNEDFMRNVLAEFKNYFPSYICMHKNLKMDISSAPNDWFCIDACDGFEKILKDLPPKITLTNFCRRAGSVVRCKRPIRLSSSKNLQHLTFLRLSNVSFRADCFRVLFSECHKLETLDMYVEKRGRLGLFRGYTTSLSKFIHLARSLKNVKMTSEDIEYEILLDALSRCGTLENVHICEYERSLRTQGVEARYAMSLIERCEELYSVFVEADMAAQQLTLLTSALREALQRRERDVCVQVCDCYSGWNPFADVFNPSPLQILD